jgi:hypothetical protein
MKDELEKNLEITDSSVNEEISRHLLGRNEENHE